MNVKAVRHEQVNSIFLIIQNRDIYKNKFSIDIFPDGTYTGTEDECPIFHPCKCGYEGCTGNVK